MSSNSYNDICPKCGGDQYSINQETRPLSMSSECLDCGFYMFSKEGQSTLEELNEIRQQFDMSELKKLKEKNYE
tara:strand:+ start:259 stop:480 length:222 start_codon:yes stop_codon:yes gene_type:complete